MFGYYKDGVGVWGYDPILGAFTPPLRLRFHVVVIMSLWSLMIHFWTVALIPDQCVVSLGVPMSVFQSGTLALAIYICLQCIIYYFLPAVSDPGGARAHKIQRIPKWDDTTTTLPEFAMKKWRCTVADESHQVSKNKFEGTKAKITGEPSGRQMWTNAEPISKDTSKKSKVDENLVQEMASGGRKFPGFNPASNPNR